jgi:hypothetical protein
MSERREWDFEKPGVADRASRFLPPEQPKPEAVRVS